MSGLKDSPQLYDEWINTQKSICITYPDYLPKLGVLSFLLNQKSSQDHDCMLLYDSPDNVRKELAAPFPDEVFNNYQLTPLLEQALQAGPETETYLFIDSYTKWVESPISVRWKDSSAKCFFLLPYSQLAKLLQI